MNELELIHDEFKKSKSRRRKTVLRKVTPGLIVNIESEIINIDSYLTSKVIANRSNGYRPSDGDADQPLRERLHFLRNLRNQMLNYMNN